MTAPIGGSFFPPQFPNGRMVNPFEAQFVRLEQLVEAHNKEVGLMEFNDLISRLSGIRPQTPKLEAAVKDLSDARIAFEDGKPTGDVLNFIQQAWNETAVPL